MAEIEFRIPHFLQAVLSSPVGSVNRGSQWVVLFERPESILPAIQLALTYEGREWQVESASRAVLGDDFQKTKGCVFAQALDVPGESLVVNPEGNIQSNAFRRSYVGQGINQLPEMRMTFLDTNVSFTDNFLRPWVLATGNFGMLARDRNDQKNYRTNIVCYKLGAYSADQPPAITQVITFFDACCTSVANEELNYAPLNSPQMREARFIYNYYSVSDAKDRGNQFLNPVAGSTQAPSVPNRP